MDQFTAEKMVNYLTDEVGIKIQSIRNKVQIPKGIWYSWMRSPKAARRIAMAEKLLEAFPEYFPDGEVPQSMIEKPKEAPNESFRNKYIEPWKEKTKNSEKKKNGYSKKIAACRTPWKNNATDYAWKIKPFSQR